MKEQDDAEMQEERDKELAAMPEATGEEPPTKEGWEKDVSRELKELNDFRAGKEAFYNELSKKQEEFEKSVEDLKSKCSDAANCVSIQEDAVREMMLGYYESFQVKKAECGVGIRETKKLEYLERDALAWAKEHKIAVRPETLDVRAFEKIVKATPDNFDFVKETIIPTATIPQKQVKE